jgi:hypothetical protein
MGNGMSDSQADYKVLKSSVKNAIQSNWSIDESFGDKSHKHWMTTPDNQGAIIILSAFVSTAGQCMLTSSVIRLHDNLRDSWTVCFEDNQLEGNLQKIFREASSGAHYYFPVSYKTCKQALHECLQRTQSSGKLIKSKIEQSVILMYDLRSNGDNVSSQLPQQQTLPEPCPAPNVMALWKVMCKKEFYNIVFTMDLLDEGFQGLGE